MPEKTAKFYHIMKILGRGTRDELCFKNILNVTMYTGVNSRVKQWCQQYPLSAHVCAKSLQLCPILCDSMDCSPPGSSLWGPPGKNTEVGCYSLLQGLFMIHGWNPCLLCLLQWQVGSVPIVPPGKPTLFIQVYYKDQIRIIICRAVGKGTWYML